MRTATLLATLALLAALAPATALAHHDHARCGASQTLVDGSVHVDAWTGDCGGAAVSFDGLVCRGLDVHYLYAHVLVLYAEGCQSGLIVGPLPPDLP